MLSNPRVEFGIFEFLIHGSYFSCGLGGGGGGGGDGASNWKVKHFDIFNIIHKEQYASPIN